MVKKLKTGVAYHGNRILKHVEEDMKDISARNMNTVLHMFTHNDWDRHLGVMKNIFDISKENGLEVWVDNSGRQISFSSVSSGKSSGAQRRHA